MARFLQIDEEGFISSSGMRVTEEAYGLSLLSHLFTRNRGYFTLTDGQEIVVEAFDQPLVAQHISKKSNGAQTLALTLTNDHSKHAPIIWSLEFAYGFSCNFSLSTLVTDDWDRFHGRTLHNIPFVLSRKAQMEFFNLVDDFDDDSVTVAGQRFNIETLNFRDQQTHIVPPTSTATTAADNTAPGGATQAPNLTDVNTAEYWSNRYRSWQSENTAPGWELGEAAKPLREVLPQIKIPRSRICVLGCGTGHDAAFFASQGHIVTAVDLSPLAIEKARATHPESANLKFFTADAFQFAKDSRAQFDIIFEHTFFCAIDPARRPEVIQAWRSLLAEGGHLLAIFFILDRIGGPPYGTTEWELREQLKPHFDFLYWTRWKTSMESRLGRELVVYARKK